MMIVSEQFYSIQGEGRTVGTPAFFLRLAGCNLMCGGQGTEKDRALHNGATWRCDTIEVWQKGTRKTFQKVVEDFGPDFLHMARSGSAHIVFTGGEPMLHQNTIRDFINFLKWEYPSNDYVFEIETNGTIRPQSFLDEHLGYWNISPKLSNSGMGMSKRINMEAVDFFLHSKAMICFKFVVSDEDDVAEVIHRWVLQFGIDSSQIWLMPGADNEHDLKSISDRVVKWCKEYGFRFSSRLHIAIWDQKTGV